MDHREQMQQEAEQWQGNAVNIIQRVRYGVLIIAGLGLLILLLQNLGFPREVKHTFGGVKIHTESGKILSCDVRIEGETTHYPFAKDKFSRSDELTVFVNQKRILTFHPQLDRETGSVYGVSKDCTFAMTPDRNRICLEMDIQKLYPQRESERCLIIDFGEDRAEALLTLQDRIGIPERLKERFAWFTGE